MNTDMQEQLSQLVERWISQQPSRSIAALSRLSGVGESSIRRLKNDGVLDLPPLKQDHLVSLQKGV